MEDGSPRGAGSSPSAGSRNPGGAGAGAAPAGGDVHERFVHELYRALLGRQPDPVGFETHRQALRSGRSPIEVFQGFVDSEEFRRRRASALTDEAPTQTAPAGAPTDERPFDLQVIIPTADGVAKLRGLVDTLTTGAPLRTAVSVLDGSGRSLEGTLERGDGRVEVHRFPGESVFHLRARVPTVARAARWVALLEDHNRVDRAWLDALARLLATAGPDDLAFVGPVANRTSQGRWSWASFLQTFALNWEPGHRFRMSSLVTNVVFARHLLGSRPFRLGYFETSLLPRLFEHARFRSDLVLDHVQECGFRRATSIHFHNSRTLGAFIRAHPASLDLRLSHLVRTTLRDRVQELTRTIARHPLSPRLPRRTLLRVRWLALAHAAGLILGWSAGMGRSPWKVE